MEEQIRMRKKQTIKNNTLGKIIFVVYLLFLVWAILFKFHFSIAELRGVRVINFIPFGGNIKNVGNLGTYENLFNIFIFIPFGVYLSMFKGNWSLGERIFTGFAVSLVFESLQFALAIGRSDTTDLIANTLGGIIGIAFYALMFKILKYKANTFINILFICVAAAIALYVAYLTTVVGIQIRL